MVLTKYCMFQRKKCFEYETGIDRTSFELYFQKFKFEGIATQACF